jgi:hypothetical protein
LQGLFVFSLTVLLQLGDRVSKRDAGLVDRRELRAGEIGELVAPQLQVVDP